MKDSIDWLPDGDVHHAYLHTQNEHLASAPCTFSHFQPQTFQCLSFKIMLGAKGHFDGDLPSSSAILGIQMASVYSTFA